MEQIDQLIQQDEWAISQEEEPKDHAYEPEQDEDYE